MYHENQKTITPKKIVVNLEKPKRKWLRRMLWAGATLIVLYFATAWYIGGKLVEPANRYVGEPPAELHAESITISSQSGSEIAGWYIRRAHSKATVLLLHQIGGNRRSMLGRAKLFRDQGYSVMMIDFQAHGESRGEKITIGHLESRDVVAAVEFIRQQTPQHRLGIVGCSLGGAAALLAGELDADAMVLEAVYPTIQEAVDNRVEMRLGLLKYIITPTLLFQLKPRLGISPGSLRPIDHLAHINCPVMILGGGKDEHTTIAETRRMFERANEPKQILIFKDAMHTDLYRYDSEKYKAQVLSFLQTHLKK